MAMADYYEGDRVGACADCCADLVRVKTVTPDGKLVWTVSHTEEGWRQHLALVPVAPRALAS